MKAKNMTINLLASIIAFAVQFIISFWLSPYVVGKLGEEAYGFLNLANNFVSYASLLVVAINSMACRFISIEYNKGNIEETNRYYASVFWTNCILYFFVFVGSLIIIYNLEKIISIDPAIVNQVKFTFLLSFINLGFSFIGTVYTAAAFSTNKMHYNSIIQILANLAKSILVVVLFVFLPARIYYLSIAILANGIITFYGNYYITSLLFKETSISWRFVRVRNVVTLIKSGSWILLSNISNIMLSGLDLLLSNQLINGGIMGRLALAKQLPAAFSNILGYFASIFNASLTKTYVTDTNEGMVYEIKLLLKILTFLLTVPFSGIIVYGYDFLTLWLRSSTYDTKQLYQIYILMIIILIDVIVSTYMYSIHSVFIALNRIRFYSITLFITSIISIFLTILCVINTSLGVYAIAGISTIVLGITHGVIVPAYAAKILKQKIYVFWLSEIKSWGTLLLICLIYIAIKRVFLVNSWKYFVAAVVINALIGYVLSFYLVLNKRERGVILNKFKR